MSDAEDFSRLARRLRDAGETGLRRELRQAISDSVKPFADGISAPGYLKPYMPGRYADVLAGDMRVTASQRASAAAYGVSVTVRGRLHRRHVQALNRGLLRHPVFARGPRQDWAWRDQADGMRPGFFDDATRAAGPEIRQHVIDAMHAVAAKIAKG